MRAVFAACAVALVAAGCSGSSASESALLPAISPDLPPAPSTWPKYPKFSSHSCWGRPDLATGPMRTAPSAPNRPVSHRTPPQALAQRVLARFGDRTLIRGVRIGPPPRRTQPYRPMKDPPRDASWAYIDAPLSSSASAPNDPALLGKRALSEWEVDLFFGALRDDFCQAGGRPLVGYSVAGRVAGMATNEYALNQRFPNPSRSEFRARVASVAKQYGFQPVAIRFLRPRELAPIVVVRTTRDRKEFIADVQEIVELLDPRSFSNHEVAQTFEGLFFEARDAHGPFVRVFDALRGTLMGGQWSAERDAYPYPHG